MRKIASYKWIVITLLLVPVFVVALGFRNYYPHPVTVDVPLDSKKLYYDLGYGFHDFFSVPVQNGKAEILPHDVNIGLIRSLGIKTSESASTMPASAFSVVHGAYDVMPFEPSAYAEKGISVKPKLVLFWGLCLSLAVTLAVRRRNSLRAFLQCPSIHSFSVLLLFYGFCAWIFYPTIGGDTVVQQLAYTGNTSLVFSALYALMADTAYLLFGDAIAGLVIFQIIGLALAMLYSWKALRLCGYGKTALLLLLLMGSSPVAFRFISFTEQRETSAVLALLSLALAVYAVLARKKWFSATFLAACVCALGATMMRYDFAGYFAGVLLLRLLPWKSCLYFLRDGAMVCMLTVCAVISGIFLGVAIDYEHNKYDMTVHREIGFYFHNLGYAFKDALLTEREKLVLEPYFDSTYCVKNWDGFSWHSLEACYRGFKNMPEAVNAFRPIALRILREKPLLYLTYRFPFFTESLKVIFGFSPAYWVIRDDYDSLAGILSNKITPDPNSQYTTSLKLSAFTPLSLRTLLNRYISNRTVAYGILYASVFLALILPLRRYRKYLSQSSLTTVSLTAACLALGPAVKFLSIVLLAPLLTASYFTDVLLFTFVFAPIFLALLIPLARAARQAGPRSLTDERSQ